MSWYDTIMEVNGELLNRLPIFIHSVRVQNIDKAMRTGTWMAGALAELLAQLDQEREGLAAIGSDAGPEAFVQVLGLVLAAQEENDYELAADLYETQIAPYLCSLQELLASQKGAMPPLLVSGLAALEQVMPDAAQQIQGDPDLDDFLSQGCGLEYTSTGDMTLRVTANGGTRYLHSNVNPCREAEELVEYWHRPSKGHYLVYGLGLAYHIEALLKKDPAARIDIFEGNLTVVAAAALSGRLHGLFTNKQVTFTYDEDGSRLRKKRQSAPDAEFLVHYPSMLCAENPELKGWLETYFIEYQAAKNQGELLTMNFRENIKLKWEGIKCLLPHFQGKRVFIVAAGPSLDKNFEELRRRGQEDVVVATGTVLRKLLGAGIEPDYVVLSDASPRLVYQRREIGDNRVPLIFLSTACHAYVKEHQGPRYIACQAGFEPAERLAAAKHFPLVETGGSVTIIAMAAALALKAEEIVFLGLDLAFTDNLRHASGTSGQKVYKTDGLIEVEDIYGQKIYTARNWELFRHRIEAMIKRYPGVRFYDATEGGVRIEGTEICRLEELLGK